jgi:hypothetical protein
VIIVRRVYVFCRSVSGFLCVYAEEGVTGAAADVVEEPVLTRNVEDFERLVEVGIY